MSGPVRVLVVDDESIVRSGVRLILESAAGIEVVGEAEDGRSAVEAARSLRPDVVLLDVRMPGMDGIEATRLMARGPDPPVVLVLTTFDLDEYVYDALRAGAGGFLLKTLPPEQLVAAVRAARSGDVLLAPAVTRRLVERFVQAPPPGAPRPEIQSLTERETDVLAALGRGLSNSEIARSLFISETTVRTHITHLFAKLGIRDRAQAVVIAYECGLVRIGERPDGS
jgi:DNA-binding NarL/FixJ family response regulator